jgi:hypothetical protein
MIIKYFSYVGNPIELSLNGRVITRWGRSSTHLRVDWEPEYSAVIPMTGVNIPLEKVQNIDEVIEYLKNR